ncbi:MAG: DegT/DnrJ/EryC1/StrS family aminotransferase [Thiotrichales bacterium]|jgi:dTDP-4-amino-4,6-dideoxygalactose transaminase|nr:DegT/DnrJ/EryC1/StrS family aminotransferase [Thiotrichales bacterium]
MILCSNPSEQFKSYQSEIELAVSTVMRSKNYILGEQVSLLEGEFAEYIGTSSAIGVANGTDAIEIALRSLNIGYGDEVITVSHTAVATVAAIEASGAKAVLVDIDPNFYTLNPNQLEMVLTKKTKAVIAVHLYGNAVDLDSVLSFCKANKIFLIEDVSQAHGAKYKGKRLGSIGDIGCFSCYPTKNLGAIGDAGLVTTNNLDLANKVRMIREYGWRNRTSMFPGRNSRLDEIQAAILRIKLKYLDSDNQKRRDTAKFYYDNLSLLPIEFPKISMNVESVFHLFVINVANQKKLIDYLKKEGVMAGIHYPLPVHLHPAYKDRVVISKDMSVTEGIVKKIVSLPIYPELSHSDTKLIVNAMKKFFK